VSLVQKEFMEADVLDFWRRATPTTSNERLSLIPPQLIDKRKQKKEKSLVSVARQAYLGTVGQICTDGVLAR
jgi:hypothetical protein